jgi:hypothetical protein
LAFRNDDNNKKMPGRDTILNAGERECIVIEILERFEKQRPMTVWEICRLISD